jgi:hypothetical protein
MGNELDSKGRVIGWETPHIAQFEAGHSESVKHGNMAWRVTQGQTRDGKGFGRIMVARWFSTDVEAQAFAATLPR